MRGLPTLVQAEGAEGARTQILVAFAIAERGFHAIADEPLIESEYPSRIRHLKTDEHGNQGQQNLER